MNRKFAIFRGEISRRWILQSPEYDRSYFDSWVDAMQALWREVAIRRATL